MTTQLSALVFTAHPDDHICCAGTLALLKKNNFIIHEVVATGGEMGTWWDENGEKKSDFNKDDLAKVRADELENARKVIGIDKTSCLGLPDSRVASTPDTVEKVLQIIRKERPLILITHNVVDYHPDHSAVSNIVVEAARRASWTYLPEFGESYRVPVLLMMEGMYFARTDLAVDITPFVQTKKRLLDVYASQIFPAERRLLEAMNDYNGFFFRDEKALSAEMYEIPDHFPMLAPSSFQLLSQNV